MASRFPGQPSGVFACRWGSRSLNLTSEDLGHDQKVVLSN